MSTDGAKRATPRHGFIGLGLMGEPMAACLVRAGLDLIVVDLRAEPVARLAELGARSAPSIGALAADVQVLHLMVVDDAQVDEVLLAPDGAIAHLVPGAVVVVHSTVSPEACRRVAAVAARRSIGFLDAPVTGGVWAAERGELTILVGGDAEALASVRPALDALASQVVHVGEVGLGQVMKIVNNLVVILNRHTLHGALRIAEAHGLQPAVALDAMRRGSAMSWAADHYDSFFEVAAQQPDQGVRFAQLARKDLDLAIALAGVVGHELPAAVLAAASVQELYAADAARGAAIDE